MFKKLLVHIPTERSPRPAVDGSISMALTFGADLEAVAVGYESVNDIPFVAEGGAAVASLFEAQYAQATEAARAALAIFEFEAKAARINYKCRAIEGSFAEAADILGAAARLCDLTIVSQPETSAAVSDNAMPLEILFQCGGPVLFIPYTFRGEVKLNRVGILWDGSRLAARALRDAMPLIRKANALTIITVNEPVSPETSPDRLAADLARQGLPARIISPKSDYSSIQPTILSAAADEGLDLLVMGAYGHSRFQELVLGGVTRNMFRSMTVPILMSH